ncbi:MAG: SAM-dependent methyltransferase [Thermoguttaceae bacterium]|jgi:methyltransferase (TIGR00027 family)
MKCQQFEGQQEVLLFEVPWEKDCEYRTNPAVLTSLLREQVPILDFVEWRVTTVEPGLAESLLPLNPPSTNQHFTHQAALLLLAADYTGGIALGSLIFGWPVVGVHPISSSKSISLWLIKGDIKYLRPSVGDLTVFAEVDREKHGRIRRRFMDGKPVLETLKIRFRNGAIDVAEAELTYFARQSEKLRSDGADPDKVNILYQLKLTSSAELIAGVRARETGKLFHDPYAARMAGQHGVSLATRFCQRSPQLGGMVAARTRHLDMEMTRFVSQGGRDVVIAGVGWDMRPFRLDFLPGTRIYELDFSTTLIERRNRLKELGLQDPPGVTRVEIPLDLRGTPLAATLEELAGRKVPVFIAWEGMSMYFQEDEVRAILQGMAPLLEHPESRLWVDLVDRRAVETPELFPNEVQAFMRGMQVLGEPFTFGTDSVEGFMASNGFRCNDVVGSDVFFEDSRDPVYCLYKFCVASRGVGASDSEGGQRWLVHPGESDTPTKPHQMAAEELDRPVNLYERDR